MIIIIMIIIIKTEEKRAYISCNIIYDVSTLQFWKHVFHWWILKESLKKFRSYYVPFSRNIINEDRSFYPNNHHTFTLWGKLKFSEIIKTTPAPASITRGLTTHDSCVVVFRVEWFRPFALSQCEKIRGKCKPICYILRQIQHYKGICWHCTHMLQTITLFVLSFIW